MKFSAPRPDLAEAAGWVARAIRSNPSMPVLAGLIIKADQFAQCVVLSAFNFESSHRAVIDAEVATSGEVLVPGQAVASFLSGMRGETVAVELDGAELSISRGPTRARFHTLPLDQYPNLPEQGEHYCAKMEASELTSAVMALNPMSSRAAGAKPWEIAIRLLGTPAGVWIYGGHLRALGRRFIECETKEPFDLLLPGRMLVDAVRDLYAELVTISYDPGSAWIVNGSKTASIRQYDPAYPGVEAVFARPPTSPIRVDRKELQDILKLVGTAGETVKLNISSDEIELISRRLNDEESDGVISDAIAIDGGSPRNLIADLRYLQPIVAGLTDEVIELLPTKGLTLHVRDSQTHYTFQTIRGDHG
jgi:DNA polymerase III subunit beta